MAVQILFCEVLLSGFILKSMQHSCVVPINHFFPNVLSESRV